MRKGIPKKIRLAAMERAVRKCERCGFEEDLVIHHDTPVSEGGDNSLKNLKVLCMPCHKATHIERGDWYGDKMASSHRSWRGEIPDKCVSSRITVCQDQEGLQSEFGLTDDEAYLVMWMMGVPSTYPNLVNLARLVGLDELELAPIMQSMIDKGFVFVDKTKEKPNRYQISRKTFERHTGSIVYFYDADGALLSRVPRGYIKPLLLAESVTQEAAGG